MELIIATHNHDKLIEIESIFQAASIKNLHLYSLEDLEDTDEVVEDGCSYKDNALIKASYYAKKYQLPTMADDSGLEIEFFNNRPGVHSARFLPTLSYPEKNKILVELLEGIGAKERNARFLSSVVIYWPNGKYISTTKSWEGKIAKEVAGNGGFGYDPIFYIPSLGLTAGELSPASKNKVSHRAKALGSIVSKWSETLPS